MPFVLPSYREIAIHAGAWLGYIGFQVLAIDRFEHRYAENLWAGLSQLPAQFIFTYTTLYWLIPAFLLKRERQYGWFWLVLAVVLAVCSVVYWQGTYYLFLVHKSPNKLAEETPWDVSRLIQSAFYLLCTSSLLIAFYMIRYAFRQQALNQQLVIVNQTIELKSLRDQINPHFLFNTLNNLYGLTSINPRQAGEVVLRLSQLMQYMLYEGNLTTVPLQQEITYLENYLALERIRYGSNLHLAFQQSGLTEGVRIAPLLLLPFVENAFKHGLSRQLGDAWLQIQLTVTSHELTFKVENSKPESPDTVDNPTDEGIGLPNVAKRLDLLYPNRHRLRQLSGTDTFLTTLTLTLTPADLFIAQYHDDPMPAGR
jgi:two-component system, LytTR family, sensor kinase